MDDDQFDRLLVAFFIAAKLGKKQIETLPAKFLELESALREAGIVHTDSRIRDR
jgi:hypothetical protein